MGSEKRKNFELRQQVKQNPCCVCGQLPGDAWNPVDPTHVKSFKVEQFDHPVNILPLCRQCHREQHNIGIYSFIKRYPKFREALLEKGWEINEHPFEKRRALLFHKDLK